MSLHPHTVSCYYVRTLGGIPRVFAEYVEGGSQIDRRADIFAFGVTLWRMLGGRIPWADKSPAIAKHSVTAMIKRGEPTDLPASLVEVILRCLEPEPDDRWADILTVAEQLRTVWSQVAAEPPMELPAPPATADMQGPGLENADPGVFSDQEAADASGPSDFPRVLRPSTQAYATWQVWIWRALTAPTSLRCFGLRDGNRGQPRHNLRVQRKLRRLRRETKVIRDAWRDGDAAVRPTSRA